VSGVERSSSHCSDCYVDLARGLFTLTFSLSNVHSALLYPNHGKAPLCRILGVSLSLFWSIPQIAGSFQLRGSASKTTRRLGFWNSMRGRVFGARLMVPKHPGKLQAHRAGVHRVCLPATAASLIPHKVFHTKRHPHPFSRHLFKLTNNPSPLVMHLV
jgi:hypothetical protein